MAGKLHPEPARVVRSIAEDLVLDGAGAVVVTGSHARGDAGRNSDIDVYAIGDGRANHLIRRGGYLVSVSWRTMEQIRDAFESPADAGTAVPGWRQAVIIHDPGGIVADLQGEALRWSWDRIGASVCDRWVAAEITGFAEEVNKLTDMLTLGDRSRAAVQRSILALRLAPILAVHHRLLYDTENRLWELVSRAMGNRWRSAQEAALGLNNETFDETCRSALELYALACREVAPLLNAEERDVVSHACALAGHPLPERGGIGERT